MNRKYTHGYTQRIWLSTDTEKVQKILEYHEGHEEPGNGTALDYAQNVLDNLNQGAERNPQNKSQTLILTALMTAMYSDTEAERNQAEMDIKLILSKYKGAERNRINSWTSNLRQEFEKLKK